MSAIDVQNSRQIRDPMDVLITLSLGTDIAMTYSGYSSAKVADGVLNQSSWPMRGLADLQGNGFPLDGSRVLYNPNTSPSQTNGKLGVRGNVGQPVSVTATGNDTIAALAITVTGAASVTLNGETTEITGSRVTLQLLNTTAVLTFQPSSEDRRIEIITILPEADFVINNDNLIKATVSLRSDLSIIDPTLPESELNVEVYQDLDISEAVASIPEDTPITYQAGYPGDMSPVRKFYVSGQVTWKDNVLSIHAVDAVHFLDGEVPLGSIGPYGYYNNQGQSPAELRYVLQALVKRAGVTAKVVWNQGYYYWGRFPDEIGGPKSVIERGRSLRELIAQAVNITRIDDVPPEYYRNDSPQKPDSYWLNYVDAGTPTFTETKPPPTWNLSEEDTSGFQKNAETPVAKIIVPNKTAEQSSVSENILQSNSIIGDIDWRKGIGAFVKYDDNVARYAYGLSRADGIEPRRADHNVLPILPVSSRGLEEGQASDYNGVFNYLYDSETQQREYGQSEGVLYSQVIPWDAAFSNSAPWHRWRTQPEAWAALTNMGLIPADADSAQLKVYGSRVIVSENETEYTADRAGITVTLDKGWVGTLCFYTSNDYDTEVVEAIPKMGYESLLKRSNITCSFTWKGDPRIQPRDVFTFHRLDGTDEEWTFENITITHEGGGTLAEVTARKGIV